MNQQQPSAVAYMYTVSDQQQQHLLREIANNMILSSSSSSSNNQHSPQRSMNNNNNNKARRGRPQTESTTNNNTRRLHLNRQSSFSSIVASSTHIINNNNNNNNNHSSYHQQQTADNTSFHGSLPQHVKNELVLDADNDNACYNNTNYRHTVSNSNSNRTHTVAARRSSNKTNSETSLASNHLGANMMQKILHAATNGNSNSNYNNKSKSSSAMIHVENNDEGQQHNASKHSKHDDNNAAVFARTAPRAGYLHKIGGSDYKRRFFVLKPSTHLYYFDTPGDSDPRGCVDLDDAQIRELETLEDGRFRFEILLHNHHNGQGDGDTKVILEARSKVVGQEWIESLKEERLSYSKQCIRRGESKQKESEGKVRELEKQIDSYHMMERERDDAVQEANEVRVKLNALDEGVRLLTRQISRPPKTTLSSSSLAGKNTSAGIDDHGSFATVPEEEHRIKELDLCDTDFGALSNACYMIRENLRLTSQEANSAIDDIHKANAETAAVQKRMKKAEKLLTKLWEENCVMREQLKQIKQEKKELGEKVRTLVDVAEEAQQSRSNLHQNTANKSLHAVDDSPAAVVQNENQGLLGEREQRLLRELEEHIATSLRLHQKFLSANAISLPNSISKSPTPLSQSVQSVDRAPDATIVHESHGKEKERLLQQNNNSATDLLVQQCATALHDVNVVTDSDGSVHKSSFSPMRPRDILADLDASGITDADEMTAPLTSTDDNPANRRGKVKVEAAVKKNPLLVLDEVDKRELGRAGSLMSTNSSISSVTDNWRATARIGSTTAETSGLNDVEGDGPQVYHLTFHSQKIGLQFQKVPAASFTRGTLSDAMASDIARKPDARDLIDAPSPNVGKHWEDESTLDVATPVDAVLVCGFRGFDVMRNDRPKLGARLVGFDGMSIERGRWTFSSVRNAIQTRGRPLTMSFRNDYLNPDQKAILDRAVRENDRGQPGNVSVPPPSHFSGGNAYADHYVSPMDGLPPRIQRSTDNMRGIEAPRRSSPPSKDYIMRTNVDKNGYSYSEAGSGSILSSTFAPLMAGLMSGLDHTHENYVDTRIPQYLRPNESSSSLNGNSRRIKDFTDELL